MKTFIERHKTVRAIMHVPVGMLNGYVFVVPLMTSIFQSNIPLPIYIALTVASVVIGILFFIGFFIYELNEDRHLKDCAYLDIFGWLIGLLIPLLAIHLWIVS